MGRGKSKRNQHTLPENRWWCVWCDERPPTVTFRTREHIIAESLGGHRNYRLDRGVVCDRCNGGVLKAIDEEMLLIAPLRYVRAQFGLGPRFTELTSGAVIDRDADHVSLDARRLPRGTSFSFTGFPNGTGHITLTSSGPSDKARGEHFTRGLHRMAYNALVHHLGPEAARDSFTFLRTLVLDLESIKTRAVLFDEQSILRAMQGPKLQWQSTYDVLPNANGDPEVVLIRIGPLHCFVSVARTTGPLRQTLAQFPWLKTANALDEV